MKPFYQYTIPPQLDTDTHTLHSYTHPMSKKNCDNLFLNIYNLSFRSWEFLTARYLIIIMILYFDSPGLVLGSQLHCTTQQGLCQHASRPRDEWWNHQIEVRKMSINCQFIGKKERDLISYLFNWISQISIGAGSGGLVGLIQTLEGIRHWLWYVMLD